MEVLEKLNIFKKTRKSCQNAFWCVEKSIFGPNRLFPPKTRFLHQKRYFSHQKRYVSHQKRYFSNQKRYVSHQKRYFHTKNDISTVSDLISRVIHRREKRMDKCQRVDCLLTSLPLAIFPTERTRPCVIIANTHHSLKTHARILTRTFTYTQF